MVSIKHSFNRISFFSFFTGAGFLDLGFEKAGFLSVFANEICDDFADVYVYSRKKMGIGIPRFGLHRKSIDCFLNNRSDKQFLADSIKTVKHENKIFGFIGGPPCPDFSVAGKNAGSTGEHGRLSSSYTDLIIENRPDFFVFENVKGLWKTKRHREFFFSLLARFENADYALSYRLVNALEYGAPQDRERIILIGVQKRFINCDGVFSSRINNFPWAKHIKYDIENLRKIDWPKTSPFMERSILPPPHNIIPELTVEYWFEKNNVLKHPNSQDFFIPRAGLDKMKTFSEGDDSKKCFKRLHRWRYSPTVAYGNNEVHLHPYLPRRLSVAEALSLQSLPAEFVLPDNISLTSKFKTIGNGVPYLLARGVAETLMDYILTQFKKAEGEEYYDDLHSIRCLQVN